MKKIQITNTFFRLLIVIILLIQLSCAKKINFQTSTVVPAARGTVKVSKDNNKNYLIKIFIRNLAEVKRLTPSKSAYIVWIETDQQVAKNIGKIDSNNKLFSNKLKASFETVYPTKPTKIFITAEDDESTQYPNNEIILTTNHF